jgi:hypothetical protein
MLPESEPPTDQTSLNHDYQTPDYYPTDGTGYGRQASSRDYDYNYDSYNNYPSYYDGYAYSQPIGEIKEEATQLINETGMEHITSMDSGIGAENYYNVLTKNFVPEEGPTEDFFQKGLGRKSQKFESPGKG